LIGIWFWEEHMRHYTHIAAVAALAAGPAFAGGIDRSGQGIGYLFETGNYVELSYGSVTPSVKSTGDAYGNIANSYSQTSLGLKLDMNSQLSFALGIDSPYGADVFYNNLDTGAKLNSTAVTALARYKFTPNLSVHGGLYQATVGGTYNPPAGLPVGSVITVQNSSTTGYVLGVAYEKPEIAARVALTYFSGTNHSDPTSNSSINAPQAVNLDFQTGIAANTLLFGGIRWADWSTTVIRVNNGNLVTYANDSMTYNLGIGRKFTDNFSGALTVGYEAAQGGTASTLAPTDGYLSIGLGATYTHENMKITAGVRSIRLGDATTTGLPLGNTWSGNSAMAAGIKVSFTF
jgi:long-chain fatty acid transport protein